MSARVAAVAAFLVSAWPQLVLACPVCSPERDDAARKAFFDTTVFLTLLPLAMFGIAVALLVRRARRLELQEDDAAARAGSQPELRGHSRVEA